jgi:tetratricopeptide (TPR) repeat protein
VPFATVPTYTERPYLTEELGVKLGKRHGGAGLAYAVAVTGLGGTGKTQLVLHYIEGHEEEYDTILWIDVRSEETARSSYERCCRALCLPIEAPTVDVPLQDIPAVQAVLLWLRSEDQNKRWLVAVDNADDLSWDVSGIVPKGRTGTVIVTSQDAQASRLLGGRTPRVRVDAMEPEEAVCLVSNYFDEPLWRRDGCLALVEEITECLDRLALAMDLAGARVRADLENGDDMATALRQYIADYKHSQDRLLRDEEFARINSYKKTVWTAWETSLASLREVEDRHSDTYPVQLLSFVTLLDRANVQDELFRLASLGLEDACNRLDAEVPPWMQVLLLSRGEDNEWDDFSYRASVKLLLRYGLVRPVGEPWKGITMHSLVQWRAGAGMDQRQHWRLYLAFMAAACVNVGKVAKTVRFRRHVVVHLPPNERLLKETSGMEEEGLWWMWSMVGQVLWEEGRWKEGEELDVKVMEARRRVLGEEHPDTITAKANLATTYSRQGKEDKAEELKVKVLAARRRVLGEEHPDTITAKANLALTYSMQGKEDKAEELKIKVLEEWRRVLGEEHPDTIRAMANLGVTYRNQGRWKEGEELEVKVLEARRRVLGEEHPDTIRAMANLGVTYRNQGRWKEAEELHVKAMEASRRVVGEEHPDTIMAIANLAATYWNQGRWKEAEELQVKVMEARRRVLDKEHPDTIMATANLAATYLNQGRWKEAEELQVKVMETSRRVLGEEHPDTITAKANLALTYSMQGKQAKAEELKVKVLEVSRRVLGEEHPDTIRAMANLASTYRNQGRWKEAEELQVKVMEARRRVLDKEHPDMIRAMANLAATYRKQGRWKEAEELQVKVMETSRRVVGEEHPDTITAMANLGVTYWNQGRSKEAEELQVKVMAVSRKVLGEEHPDTIRAMANLAYTKRDLGRADVAIDLMEQSATASSRVLGDHHPDCRSRREQAALWSSVIIDDDGDDDQDIDRAVHSDDDGGVAVL